ncbi:MAG: amino acid ABC transporter permease [Brachymonas sp.]|nr:amino acid ABC transporter permease [Brachymonas sp.]
MIWAGLWMTLGLTLASAFVGGILGVLGAIGLRYGGRVLTGILLTYVEVVRNTPFLVQLFFIFFGLPSLGIMLPEWAAALLAMTLNLAAYQMEIIRAGFLAVGAGQFNAALSLGMKRSQAIRYIMLPQGFAAIGPALFGQILMMMMSSAVVSQISVNDLAAAASFIQSRTFRPFEIYILVTLLYLVLSIAARSIFNLTFGRKYVARKFQHHG